MSISVQQMADRVAELMEARLRVKGEGLAAKLQRGGRYLPRKVLGAAQFLAMSCDLTRTPRLNAQLDPERVAKAYDICVRHLKPLGSGARRKAMALRIATSVTVIALVTVALVAWLLIWRGYL